MIATPQVWLEGQPRIHLLGPASLLHALGGLWPRGKEGAHALSPCLALRTPRCHPNTLSHTSIPHLSPRQGDVGEPPREPKYSRGIRQAVYRHHLDGNWRTKHKIFILAPREDPIGHTYSQMLARSIFCLVAPGGCCARAWCLREGAEEGDWGVGDRGGGGHVR